MLVLNSPTEIKPLNLPNIVCALGVFDGIHLGHQKIIKALVRNAKSIKGISTIITFNKHPYSVLNPSYDLSILTSPAHKLQLIDKMNVDVCIMLKFNKATASITAENWIREVLWKQLHINSIYIGQDSFFGKDRKGDINLLLKWSNSLGFKVNVIEPLRINKVSVSSTLIRNYICKGNIKSAQTLLGRPYSALGTVIKGKGRGKKLGFPTANLDTGNQCLPFNGVYAVKAKIDTITTPGVANIGIKPTFKPKQTKPLLEVHLIKGSDELYNKNMEIIFVERLRNEMKFTTTSELTKQIEKDIVRAEQILS